MAKATTTRRARPGSFGESRPARRRAPPLLSASLAVLALPALLTLSSCSDAEVLTLFVGPEEVECFGVGPRTCLQVRESPDEPWRNFFDSIQGFDFEPGFLYELVVEKRPVSPVEADGSSYRYRLLRVVSKAPADEG
jgi:hypothetical protein